MPSAYITFGDANYEVTPETFLLEQQTITGLKVCILGFSYNTQGLYILGDVFLSNYYTVYDASSEAVGLATSVTSNAKITTNFPVWAIVLIVLGVFIIIGGIAGGVYYNRKKKGSGRRVGG